MLNRIPPHMLVAGSAWLSRLITAAVGLVSIRILIQGLGTDQYAVYAVLGGLQGWYMLADLGIGTSLQNHISERRAGGHHYEDLVVTAGIVTMSLMLLSVVLLYMASPLLAPLIMPGFAFLNALEKTDHFFIVGVISIVTCAGSVVYRIWYAEQKGYLANILPAGASIISLIAVSVVSRGHHEHKLYWSLVAAFGPAGVIPIAAFLYRFGRNLLRLRGVKRDVLLLLVKRGLKFWLTAIMAAGVLQVDYLVLARYLPAKEIVVYNLTAKIFALVYFMYASILNAIWPLCAEAIAKKLWTEVLGYVRRYIYIGVLLMSCSTILLVFLMPHVVGLLAPGKVVHVPVFFIILVGLYNTVRIWSDTFAMVLQSMSYLRPFIIYIPLQALITIVLQMIFAPRFGVSGILYGLIFSFLLTSVWILPWCVARRRNMMVGKV